jgi:hypothetical protein
LITAAFTADGILLSAITVHNVKVTSLGSAMITAKKRSDLTAVKGLTRLRWELSRFLSERDNVFPGDFSAYQIPLKRCLSAAKAHFSIEPSRPL